MKLKCYFFLIIILGLPQILIASTASESSNIFGNEDIHLIMGEVKILEHKGVTQIAIGEGAILQAQVLKSGELLLIGQGKGTTSLQVWHSQNQRTSYRVNIADAIDEQDITLRKIVSMKVRIIEFRESSLKQIGLDWSKSSTGPNFFIAKDLINSPNGSSLNALSTIPLNMVGNTQDMPIFLGSTLALNSTIRFLQSGGHASTLAEPTLSCLSGQSASFLAGGEVPYSTFDEQGIASVSFKDYGIKLEVTPKADRHGRISTAINTEVSSIDGSVSVNGAPGFLTRRTQTHMNVMSGQTIIISGLLTKNARQDIDFIPGLGNIPVIGNFFQNKNWSKEEIQLVIFVTPSIIDPTQLQPEQSVTSVNESKTKLKSKELQNILDSSLADIQITVGQ